MNVFISSMFFNKNLTEYVLTLAFLKHLENIFPSLLSSAVIKKSASIYILNQTVATQIRPLEDVSTFSHCMSSFYFVSCTFWVVPSDSYFYVINFIFSSVKCAV